MQRVVLLLIPILLLSSCRSTILEDPSTAIRYSVPQPSHAKLTIENSYNTIVATLIDADLQVGTYVATYDATGLQEGIYFYTLELKGINNGFYQKTTKNLLLLK